MVPKYCSYSILKQVSEIIEKNIKEYSPDKPRQCADLGKKTSDKFKEKMKLGCEILEKKVFEKEEDYLEEEKKELKDTIDACTTFFMNSLQDHKLLMIKENVDKLFANIHTDIDNIT